MSIVDKIKNMTQSVPSRAQAGATSLFLIAIRLISVFFLALIIGLIFQQLFSTGNLIFVFFAILTGSILYRYLSRMSLGQILIFDLICILIGTILRMYVHLAPLH